MPIGVTSKLLVSALVCWFGVFFYLMWRPFEWSEEVQTLSPQPVVVLRSVEREIAWSKRHGLGPIRGHSLMFVSNGGEVHWHTGPNWTLNHMPEILSFIDGDPVLIFSVAQFVPCSSVGFPRDGLVGFRYRNKEWTRTNTARLPANLKVNLLRDTFDFQRRQWHHLSDLFSHEYKAVSLGRKETLESPLQLPQLGSSIEKLSAQYAKYLDSCANVKAFSQGGTQSN